jgi:hypothetical protein
MGALEMSIASILGDDTIDKRAALAETCSQAHEYVQKAFASTAATAKFVAKAIAPAPTEIRKQMEDDPKPYTKPKGYRKPKSVSSRDAGDRLVERAAALRSALNISQDDAIKRVIAKNPELAKLHKREIAKGMDAGDENDLVPGQDYGPPPDSGEWSNPGPNRGARSNETLNDDAARVFDGSSVAGDPRFRGQPMSVIGAGSGGDDDDALMAMWQAWKVKLPSLTPDDVANILNWRMPPGSTGPVSKAANSMQRLHALAAATQRQHPNMSADECLNHVATRNPDLLRAATMMARNGSR